MKPKKISCKWCGMGHAPCSNGNHWIVRSIFPVKIDIKECAYHKAGEVSPIQHTMPIEPKTTYSVEERKGWSYIVGAPLPCSEDHGPWRYRWEAQEYADELNAELERQSNAEDVGK